MQYMRWFLCLVALIGGAVTHASKSLPARDLTVELRQIEETYGEPAGYSVSAGNAAEPAALRYQKLLVRNGEKATVEMLQSTAKQWTQSVVSSGTGGNTLGVNQQVEWLEAGYVITVQPKWPGGNRSATVAVELEQKDLVPGNQADTPQQARRKYNSTITVPLAQWVTILSRGEVPKSGTYSTSSTHKMGRQALQIRVLVP
jgi:hypothetical protein